MIKVVHCILFSRKHLKLNITNVSNSLLTLEYLVVKKQKHKS